MHSNFLGLACLPLYLVEFMVLNSVRDKDLNLGIRSFDKLRVRDTFC